MTDRDRLIGLIKECDKIETETLFKTKKPLDLDEWAGIYADHLLANGVIVLLCKVGDKVYIPDDFGRIEAEIESIEITEHGLMYEWVKYDRGVDETEVWDEGSFSASGIGKDVFLSYEEYEKHFVEGGE